MLCAQVFKSAVTECLSGSCNSFEVMYRYTDCKKGLAAGQKKITDKEVVIKIILKTIK